jgi:hypothetical protein
MIKVHVPIPVGKAHEATLLTVEEAFGRCSSKWVMQKEMKICNYFMRIFGTSASLTEGTIS